MTTALSVNLNKIALLRNSRGRDYPNVVNYAMKFIELGVQGITIHPRQDERHAKKSDAFELARLLKDNGYENIELNIEGFPSEDFLDLVEQVNPDQCTLVPDDANQLTSDHGWNVVKSGKLLSNSLERINSVGVRSALFVDPDTDQIRQVADLDCDRIELYTESFAVNFGSGLTEKVFDKYAEAAFIAQSSGLGVNAGHDLDLNNLGQFLKIEGILEVSIGHALTVECLDQGMSEVVQQYLKICA